MPLGLAVFSLALGCSKPAPSPAAPEPAGPKGPSLEWSYGTTQGEDFSSAGTRGRATALLFATTYDLASQVLAQRLESVLRSHVPRANGGAVILEAPKYAVMADAWRTTLNLSYPIAMADQATIDGQGPFGPIAQIPTLVVLDRSGREVWRKPGVPTTSEIKQALALGSRSGFARPP